MGIFISASLAKTLVPSYSLPMRDDEWDLIEAGDLIDYLPSETEEAPTPTPLRFQVYQIRDEKVYAVRMMSNRDDGTASFAITETAVLSRGAPRWTLVRLRSKVMATGGFRVKRAATGEEEYDKCPSALDRSKKAPQTLEGRS